MHGLVKERLCIPSCVMGTCINGQCNCMPGFFGIDCSGIIVDCHKLKVSCLNIKYALHFIAFIDSCSSRIPRCIQCRLKTDTAGEVFCTACETDHELVENECKRRWIP